MRATTTYSTDHLELIFEGDYEEYEEGDEVTNVECVSMLLLGEPFDMALLSETARTAIYEIGYELEFDIIDSSDADDQGEDE